MMKRAIGGGKSSIVVVPLVVPLEDTSLQQQQQQQQPPSSQQQRQSLSSSSSSSFISPMTTTNTTNTTNTTITSMVNMNHTTPMNPTVLPSSSSTTTKTTSSSSSLHGYYHNLRRLVYHQYQQHYHIMKHHLKSLNGKKIISSTVFTVMILLIMDSIWSTPDHRIVPPNFANDFLLWVSDHPGSGLIWILLLMSISVICMIPIGTPLTLGCGYIYKGAYGWQLGIFIATCVSMIGSALGAVICFLLGRYLMRDMVKKWIRKYPIFDAIDIAAAEHGLRIMAMLYLTPILPLGPVSYMCGTTSLKLSHFILAKIAALPLMMLYVLIGASTGTLISTGTSTSTSIINNNNNNMDTAANPAQSIEHNRTLIISGILLSFASIAGITHYIKKELNHILERQKRELEHNGTSSNTGIEFSHMCPTTASNITTTPSKDIESGTVTTSSTSAYDNNFIHILENDLVTTTTTTTPSSTVTLTAIAPTTQTIPSLSSSTTTTTTSIPTTTLLLLDDSNGHLSVNTAPRQRKQH